MTSWSGWRGASTAATERWRFCYHEDGWDAHGSFNDSAAEFVDRAIEMQTAQFTWTSHYIGNVYIELDGDTAAVEPMCR